MIRSIHFDFYPADNGEKVTRKFDRIMPALAYFFSLPFSSGYYVINFTKTDEV